MRNLELAPSENRNVYLRRSDERSSDPFLVYEVVRSGEETVIGICKLRYDIYANEINLETLNIDSTGADDDCQRKGYGTEAATQLVDAAFCAYPTAHVIRARIGTSPAMKVAKGIELKAEWSREYTLINFSQGQSQPGHYTTYDGDEALAHVEAEGIVEMRITREETKTL